MLRKYYLFLCALLPGLSFAAPMAPGEKAPPGNFDGAVKSEFVLLADSEDDRLVYYVPLKGGIAINAKSSPSPIPRFQIYDFYPTYGIFAGQVLTRLGGTFDTTGYLSSLAELHAQAALSNPPVQVVPSPATTATTKFLLSTKVLEGERLNVNCDIEITYVITPTGDKREIKTPICFAEGEDGEYDLNTNVMYKFSSMPALGGSVVSQTIPFSAVTLPGIDEEFRPFMVVGGQWDGGLAAVVDWEIKANTKTREARVIVNWSTTFEQASAFAAIHANSCIDIEMQEFYRNLASCDDPDECGVRLEYFDDDTQTWTLMGPDEPDFITQAVAFRDNIERELFNEVEAYETSVLGEVSKEKTSFFTLRANYEKQLLDRNETRYFTWTPGYRTVNARTSLSLGCMKGGFESGRVTWNMDDPGCRSLVGQ